MKLRHIFTGALMAMMMAAPAAQAERLVILHTNDTHSQIDPDDATGLGGIGRRKVLIDSVRQAEPNVLLVDAGDAVQGTLYFNLYGGKVEQELMNALDYDFRILGNHEFDNGVDSLAAVLRHAAGTFLSTNYELSKTPLSPMFRKYDVREVGDRRIGFIAINLKPEGMISEGNYDGVEYLDAIEAANSAAWWLKHVERCDLVVAITHIGYNPVTPPGDVMLAENSRDIDIIIGGHSHDVISSDSSDKPCRIKNLDGKEVLVTQTGKAGRFLGQINIDLDSLTDDYRLLRVDSRLDSRVPQSIKDMIAPYRAGVDSLMTRTPVGRTKHALAQVSPELLNWATDLVLDRGRQLAPDVDMAILNKGGLRRGLPKGTVNEGQIITMMPFNNRVRVIDIKGADLMEAFNVMAHAGGNGVSRGVEIVYEPGDDAHVESAVINGKPLDPNRTYRVATIDYIANGGDYMSSMKRHTQVAESPTVLYRDVLDYLRHGAGKGRTINPDGTVRMHPEND